MYLCNLYEFSQSVSVALTGSYVINEALEQICEVCVESSVPHIHIETGRLLSSVVKYCQDESKCLKPLINQFE